MRYIIPVIFFLVINSCTSSHQRASDSISNKESFIPPVTIPAGKPFLVNPDTCPPARCIAIPSKSGNCVIDVGGVAKSIPLQPPATRTVDFFVGLQNFNTDKGLALSSILSSCIDRNGNLWLGTDGGGASRYDGKSFTNFTMGHGLANNSVYCITEDKSGNIWFGTNGGGVSRYDGKSFISFTTANGIANNSVHSITETKDGKLWMVTKMRMRVWLIG